MAVCDWWSFLQCLWLVKSVAMSAIGEVLCNVCEVCCNVRDRWSCYSACDWWSLLQCFSLVNSVAMSVIGEVCCDVCDWWKIENQKLYKKPCCLYCIIDGVNIQNLGTGLSKDHFRPNLVSLYPMVQQIFNFVKPIRSHGSNIGCMEKSLDTILEECRPRSAISKFVGPIWCCLKL